MSIPAAWPQVLDFFGTRLVIEPPPGQRSSGAGLLPVRPFDQRIGLTRAFAEALDDPRDPDLTEHNFLEMARARVYGILASYEGQNDHDTLRADPVQRPGGKVEGGDGPAGQAGRRPVREHRADSSCLTASDLTALLKERQGRVASTMALAVLRREKVVYATAKPS
jgi:hypothetical protein